LTALRSGSGDGRRTQGPRQVRLRQEQAERRQDHGHLADAGYRSPGAEIGGRVMTPPHRKSQNNAPDWYEELYERQCTAYSSRGVRVEHGIAHLKNRRAPARHRGRRDSHERCGSGRRWCAAPPADRGPGPGTFICGPRARRDPRRPTADSARARRHRGDGDTTRRSASGAPRGCVQTSAYRIMGDAGSSSAPRVPRSRSAACVAALPGTWRRRTSPKCVVMPGRG
jgi:hypothetical protein